MISLLKSFGCFLAVLSLSFSVKAETETDNSGSQDTDTSIATKEIVIAAAEKSPIGSYESTSIIVERGNALPADDVVAESLAVSEKNYSTLHPMAISFVRKYEDRNEERLERIVTKYARQMVLIDKILIRHELPVELKYLALIESEMFNGAVSHKGAVGPWQFMATTGRLMGLTINRHRDERRDLTKSTHAAAKYLKILYNQFGDWLLVIAAYNGGAGRVESAIKKSRSTDFWKLQYYLPAESRAHVKKYVAACYILAKPVEEDMPQINMDRLMLQNLNDLSVLTIQGKYNSEVICQALSLDMATFNRYNPGFEQQVAADGYDMRLPMEKMKLFNAKRREILNESIEALLKENNTIFSANKNDYPEAIALPKTKGIISTAGQQKMAKR